MMSMFEFVVLLTIEYTILSIIKRNDFLTARIALDNGIVEGLIRLWSESPYENVG
jgi:hypothetical protein